MLDAAGNLERFNKESAIVIARKEFLGTNTPLPISFVSFNAFKTPNNKAELNWEYVTDETIARFDIQRMIAGNTFETIETVEKTAGSKEISRYSYLDQNPYAGKNFYRIKAKQEDGKEVLTNIKMVDIPVNNQLSIVKSYPNPATNTFNITLVSPEQKQAVVKVYNTTGLLVMEQTTTLSQGTNQVALNIESLASGMYSVVIISGNETVKTRVVKN